LGIQDALTHVSTLQPVHSNDKGNTERCILFYKMQPVSDTKGASRTTACGVVIAKLSDGPL
jgi:hypothetical protein